MQTVSEIMEQLGGIATVAAETGFPFTTVHSWKRSGHVPEWRKPALLKLAKSRGVPLKASDFPDRTHSARSSNSQVAA